MIALLIAEGPNAKLKRASVFEAARLQLNRDITDTEFQKVRSTIPEIEKDESIPF